MTAISQHSPTQNPFCCWYFARRAVGIFFFFWFFKEMGSGPASGLNSPVSGEPTQAFSPRPCPGSPSPSPLGIQIGSPFRAQLDRQLRRTDSRSPAWTPPRPALRGEDPGPLAVTGREQRPPGGARGAGRARRRRGASEESEGPPARPPHRRCSPGR